MVQIKIKMTECLRVNMLKGLCWFPLASLARRLQSVQSRVAVPREGETGRGPPEYLNKPQRSRGCPQSPGAPEGGRGSLPRGSREEPGSSGSVVTNCDTLVTLGNLAPQDRN